MGGPAFNRWIRCGSARIMKKRIPKASTRARARIYAASFRFQSPGEAVQDAQSMPPLPPYIPDMKIAQNALESPESIFPEKAPDPVDVCPLCKRPTEVYAVFCNGKMSESHRCYRHGEVVPILSAVYNE